MKAYIYRVETHKIIAKIKGDDSQSIEAKFDELGYDTDLYWLTYGFIDGLVTDGDFDVIDVRG